MQIEIEVTHGSPNSIDIARAEHAALDVLGRGGTEDEAQRAADLALTKGWADPDGAGCCIIVHE